MPGRSRPRGESEGSQGSFVETVHVMIPFAPVSATAYEQAMGRWSRLLAPPFIDFAGVRGGEAVLDVGCGTGSLTFAVAERVPGTTIAGIDALATSLDFARSINPDPGRISFELADARALPFEASRFDRTLSALVINFIPDSAAGGARDGAGDEAGRHGGRGAVGHARRPAASAHAVRRCRGHRR